MAKKKKQTVLNPAEVRARQAAGISAAAAKFTTPDPSAESTGKNPNEVKWGKSVVGVGSEPSPIQGPRKPLASDALRSVPPVKRKVETTKRPKRRNITTEERIAAARALPTVKGNQAMDTSRAEDSAVVNTLLKLALAQEADKKAGRRSPSVVQRARDLNKPTRELHYNEMTDTEKGHLIGDISAGVIEHRNLSSQLTKSAQNIRKLGASSEEELASNMQTADSMDAKAAAASAESDRLRAAGVRSLENRDREMVPKANAMREGSRARIGKRTLIAKVPANYDLEGSVASERSGNPRVRFLSQNAEVAAKDAANNKKFPNLDAVAAPTELGGYVTPSASELASGKVITRRSQNTLSKRKARAKSDQQANADADALEKAGNKKAAVVIRKKLQSGPRAAVNTKIKEEGRRGERLVQFEVAEAPAEMAVMGDAGRNTSILRNQFGLRHMTVGREGEARRAIEQARAEITQLQQEPPLGVSGTLVEGGKDVRVGKQQNPLTSVDQSVIDSSSVQVGLGQLHKDISDRISDLRKKKATAGAELSKLGEAEVDSGGESSEAYAAKQAEYRSHANEISKLKKELRSYREVIPAVTRKGKKTVIETGLSPEQMDKVDPLNRKLKVTGQGQSPKPTSTTARPESVGVESGVSVVPYTRSPRQGMLFKPAIDNPKNLEPVIGSRGQMDIHNAYHPLRQAALVYPSPVSSSAAPKEPAVSEGYQRTIFDAMGDLSRESTNRPEASTEAVPGIGRRRLEARTKGAAMDAARESRRASWIDAGAPESVASSAADMAMDIPDSFPGAPGSPRNARRTQKPTL